MQPNFETNKYQNSSNCVFKSSFNNRRRVFYLTNKRVERERRSCNKQRSVKQIAEIIEHSEITNKIKLIISIFKTILRRVVQRTIFTFF